MNKSDHQSCIAMPSIMVELNRRFAQIMQDENFQRSVLKDHADYREEYSDDDILNSAFLDRYATWMEDLEKRGRFQGNTMEVYRGISVEKLEDINFKTVGIYWTWDKRKAANYSNTNTKTPVKILTAQISIDDIDLKETLRKAVWAGYTFEESEREITMKRNAKLNITSPFKREARASSQPSRFLDRLLVLAAKKTEYFVWDELESDGIAHGPTVKQNAILKVLGFSRLGLRIEGQAPFKSFKFTWWSPYSGIIQTELSVVSQDKKFFEAKFKNPKDKNIIKEIDFWQGRYPKKAG